MNPKRQEIVQIVVGAAVSCFVVGAVAMIYGAERLIDEEAYEIHATFGKVDGLKVGGTVMAAGVPVGRVASLTLTEDFRATAVLRVDRSIELDTDASAAVVTDGLFGEKFVRLDIGGADAMIPNGGTVTYTQEPVIIDDLLNQIISLGEANLKKRKAE